MKNKKKKKKKLLMCLPPRHILRMEASLLD